MGDDQTEAGTLPVSAPPGAAIIPLFGPEPPEAAQVLSAGRKAIKELSELATADPRTLNDRIGLTQMIRIANGRW